MFLHFYESNCLVGIFFGQFRPPKGIPIIITKKAVEFNIDDPDQEYFGGWETEENQDGTFYLVFVNKITYYLGRVDNDYYSLQMFCEKSKATPLVFNEERTTIMFKETFQFKNKIYHFILHIKHGEILSADIHNNKTFNQVWLANSNTKQYTLK